jgi:deoxyadenosine/deoxycytidine kinase
MAPSVDQFRASFIKAHSADLLDKFKLQIDVDQQDMLVDIVSKKKSTNRVPEKVLSVQLLTNSSVDVMSMICCGERVDDEQTLGLLGKCGVAVDKENLPTSASNKQDIVSSPSIDNISTRKRPRSSYAFTGYGTVDMTGLVEICKRFFDSSFAATSSVTESISKYVPLIDPDRDFHPILVSIEGNIGAGKSTLLKKLRDNFTDYIFIDEPVDTWTSLVDDDGTSLLGRFYEDQLRWAYTFQNCAVLSRFINIEKCIGSHKVAVGGPKRVVFITERCLDTDHKVFANMMLADGKMGKIEYQLYCKWFDMIHRVGATPLSAIVHLKTNPDTCSDRILQRSRTGEEGIPIDYLRMLDQFQQKWCDSATVPVLTFDPGFNDLEEMASNVGNFISGLVEKVDSKPVLAATPLMRTRPFNE